MISEGDGAAPEAEVEEPNETFSEEEFIAEEGVGDLEAHRDVALPFVDTPLNGLLAAMIDSNYAHLDPERLVPTTLLQQALAYFESNKQQIPNQRYLCVVDFKPHSRSTRFYEIDMTGGEVWAMHTSHGKGSDPDDEGFAKTFSNVKGSNQSSIGFYLTAETYISKRHGLSLRLDGLSKTNSMARPRAVVVHTAPYVQEQAKKQGRSLGCFVIALENRDRLIDHIKEGSLIYANTY